MASNADEWLKQADTYTPKPTDYKLPFDQKDYRAKRNRLEKYDHLIESFAKIHGEDIPDLANLARAVMMRESGGHANLTSSAGAGGLMQIMPATFEEMGGNPADLYDPVENIDKGIKYLAQQLRTFKEPDLALAAYNAGPGRKALKEGRIPEFDETKQYVAAVLGYRAAMGGLPTPAAPAPPVQVASADEWLSAADGLLAGPSPAGKPAAPAMPLPIPGIPGIGGEKLAAPAMPGPDAMPEMLQEKIAALDAKTAQKKADADLGEQVIAAQARQGKAESILGKAPADGTPPETVQTPEAYGAELGGQGPGQRGFASRVGDALTHVKDASTGVLGRALRGESKAENYGRRAREAMELAQQNKFAEDFQRLPETEQKRILANAKVKAEKGEALTDQEAAVVAADTGFWESVKGVPLGDLAKELAVTTIEDLPLVLLTDKGIGTVIRALKRAGQAYRVGRVAAAAKRAEAEYAAAGDAARGAEVAARVQRRFGESREALATSKAALSKESVLKTLAQEFGQNMAAAVAVTEPQAAARGEEAFTAKTLAQEAAFGAVAVPGALIRHAADARLTAKELEGVGKVAYLTGLENHPAVNEMIPLFRRMAEAPELHGIRIKTSDKPRSVSTGAGQAAYSGPGGGDGGRAAIESFAEGTGPGREEVRGAYGTAKVGREAARRGLPQKGEVAVYGGADGGTVLHEVVHHLQEKLKRRVNEESVTPGGAKPFTELQETIKAWEASVFRQAAEKKIGLPQGVEGKELLAHVLPAYLGYAHKADKSIRRVVLPEPILEGMRKLMNLEAGPLPEGGDLAAKSDVLLARRPAPGTPKQTPQPDAVREPSAMASRLDGFAPDPRQPGDPRRRPLTEPDARTPERRALEEAQALSPDELMAKMDELLAQMPKGPARPGEVVDLTPKAPAKKAAAAGEADPWAGVEVAGKPDADLRLPDPPPAPKAVGPARPPEAAAPAAPEKPDLPPRRPTVEARYTRRPLGEPEAPKPIPQAADPDGPAKPPLPKKLAVAEERLRRQTEREKTLKTLEPLRKRWEASVLSKRGRVDYGKTKAQDHALRQQALEEGMQGLSTRAVPAKELPDFFSLDGQVYRRAKQGDYILLRDEAGRKHEVLPDKPIHMDVEPGRATRDADAYGAEFLDGETAADVEARDAAQRETAERALREAGIERLAPNQVIRDGKVVGDEPDLLPFSLNTDRHEIPTPLSEGASTGNPPRVEARVESLRAAEESAGKAPSHLDRQTRESWASQDPAIRRILKTWSDDMWLDTAKRRTLDRVEAQAYDAVIRGKREAAEALERELGELRRGGDAKAIAAKAQEAMVAKLDYITHERNNVNDGTATARALAARRRIMAGAKVNSDGEMIRKILKEIPGATDDNIKDLLDIWKNRPGEFNDALRGLMKAPFWDKFYEIYRAGLLSAFVTDIRNVLGNAAYNALRTVEALPAAAVDKTFSALTGGARTRYLDDAGQEAKGFVTGFVPAFRHLLGNMRDVVTLKDKTIDASKEWKSQIGAVGTGPETRFRPAERLLGKVVRTSYRKLEAEDFFFKEVIMSAELHKRALWMARREGLDGRAAKDRADAIVKTYREPDGPSKLADLHEELLKAADERTFQSQPGNIGQILLNARRKVKALNLILPFIQTPANVLGATIERTPFGFRGAAKAVAEFKAAKREGADPAKLAELQAHAVDRITRATTGTAVMAGLYGLAQAGFLTGSGPEDRDANRVWRDAGNQPYSFSWVDGDGKRQYIGFSHFEPVSSLLGIAADLGEIDDQAEADEKFWKGVGAFTENLINKTYLEGLNNTFAFMESPEKMAGAYFSGLAGSFVPNIVARAAQATDPIIRDTKQTDEGLASLYQRPLNTIKARIPGVSKTLPAKADTFGNEIERSGNAASRFAWPVVGSEEKPVAPLANQMVDIGYVPKPPGREVEIGGETYRLTTAEHEVMLAARRKAAEKAARIAKLASFQRLDADQKEKRIRAIFDGMADPARARVKAMVLRRTRAESRR